MNSLATVALRFGTILLLSLPPITCQAADRYKNFAELALHERQGVDYQIATLDRRSASVIVAVHGGKIERGTSELAKLIAGRRFSLYLFEGIKRRNNRHLHLTSTHFDEPNALRLVGRSRFCISVHGERGNSGESICLGGAHKGLRRAVATSLKGAGFANVTIKEPCPSFPGQEPKNIVNRCKSKSGVQLELSRELRDEILSDPVFAARLAKVIRDAVTAFAK